MFCCPPVGGFGKVEPYKDGAYRNTAGGFYIPWINSRQIHQVYQIGPLIGKGSFANVHECRTIVQPHTYYAVKVIDRRRLRSQDLRHFHDEVQILLEVQPHNNIISIHELYRTRDFFFVVMEKLNGGELFDRLAQKEQYTEQEARDVCRDVLEAVAYCHEQSVPVAHRDLKPENLLLVSPNSDQVKVADFGFARRVTRPYSLRTRLGTPCYMAPEIVNNDLYDERVDNWSLGVIVYMLLGGENPFFEDTVHLTMQQIRQSNYNFKSENWAGISPDAKNFIKGLLTRDPEQRLSSTEALVHTWMTGKGELLGRNSINMHLFKRSHAEYKEKKKNAKSVSFYWLVARR
jgi:serine/threonine protein kinase